MAAIAAGLSMLGQLAIATYPPAFAAIGSDVRASTAQIQPSLTAYLLPLALLLPWHGAPSTSR
jgi:DHA1 family bicyclomycin/chloramphenicol resistance-like MFS transporter